MIKARIRNRRWLRKEELPETVMTSRHVEHRRRHPQTLNRKRNMRMRPVKMPEPGTGKFLQPPDQSWARRGVQKLSKRSREVRPVERDLVLDCGECHRVSFRRRRDLNERGTFETAQVGCLTSTFTIFKRKRLETHVEAQIVFEFQLVSCEL